MPRVSVIMNCRNSAAYLREAIDSVYAQTYGDWEIVFWDNASTDESAAIAQSYDPRLRYFYGDSPVPLGAARNLALAKRRGEFVALLDCDDFWVPEKLARQVVLLESDPAFGMVYSDNYIWDQRTGAKTLLSKRTPPAHVNPYVALLTGRNFIQCLTVLMRSSAVDEADGFNSGLTYTEEYELFLKILRRHRLAYISEPLATFRLHGGNATGLGSIGTTREMLWVMSQERKHLDTVPLGTWIRMQQRRLLLNGKLAVQRLAGLAAGTHC